MRTLARNTLRVPEPDFRPCGYRRLRLILQALLPAECNNVTGLVFAAYPPQKIDEDTHRDYIY